MVDAIKSNYEKLSEALLGSVVKGEDNEAYLNTFLENSKNLNLGDKPLTNEQIQELVNGIKKDISGGIENAQNGLLSRLNPKVSLLSGVKSGLTDAEHQKSFDTHASKIEEALKTHGVENLTDEQAKEVRDAFAKNHIGEGAEAGVAARDAAVKKIEGFAKQEAVLGGLRSGLTDAEHQKSFDTHASKIEEALKTHGVENLTVEQAKELQETFAKAHKGEKAGEAALNATVKKIEGYGLEIKNATAREGLVTKIVDKFSAEEKGKVTDKVRGKINEYLKKNNLTDATEEKISATAKSLEEIVKKGGKEEDILASITKAMDKHLGLGFFAKRFVSPISGNIGKTFSDAWNNDARGLAFGKSVVTLGGVAAAVKGFSDLGKQDEQGETHNGVAALEITGGTAAALAGLTFKSGGMAV